MVLLCLMSWRIRWGRTRAHQVDEPAAKLAQEGGVGWIVAGHVREQLQLLRMLNCLQSDTDCITSALHHHSPQTSASRSTTSMAPRSLMTVYNCKLFTERRARPFFFFSKTADFDGRACARCAARLFASNLAQILSVSCKRSTVVVTLKF